MKIIGANYRYFQEIGTGQVFVYEHAPYIRLPINGPDPHVNAVNLETGEPRIFKYDTKVIAKEQARLILE